MLCDICKKDKKTVFVIPNELKEMIPGLGEKACISCLENLDEQYNIFDNVSSLDITGDSSKYGLIRYSSNKTKIDELEKQKAQLEIELNKLNKEISIEMLIQFGKDVIGISEREKQILEIEEKIRKLK